MSLVDSLAYGSVSTSFDQAFWAEIEILLNEDDEELLQHSFIQLDTQLQAKVAQHPLDIGHPLILVFIHIIVRWHVDEIALLNT